MFTGTYPVNFLLVLIPGSCVAIAVILWSQARRNWSGWSGFGWTINLLSIE